MPGGRQVANVETAASMLQSYFSDKKAEIRNPVRLNPCVQ